MINAFPSRSWLLSAAVPLVATACLFPTGNETDERLDELNQNRQRWESQGITDYYLRQRKICLCVPDLNRLTSIEVRGGLAVAWTDVDTGDPVSEQIQNEFLTVTDLFDLIQDAIDREAASLIVEYHDELGFPLDVSIDYNTAVADEEVRYETPQITTWQ